MQFYDVRVAIKLVPCFELLRLDPLSAFDNLHHADNSLPRAIRKIKIKFNKEDKH